jgi:hypothetical protein
MEIESFYLLYQSALSEREGPGTVSSAGLNPDLS